MKPGKLIQTKDGKKYKLGPKIGEGGQAIVYKVTEEETNKEYAFKMYRKKTPENFYVNLEKNIEMGAPASTFLWPISVTEKNKKGVFGYVMPLIPEGYYSFTQYLLNKRNFQDFAVMIKAAIFIVSSFRILHQLGLSYQDLNDQNIYINFESGSILFIDNDNISADGINYGVLGTAHFMAPEVIALNANPDIYSDRFSMLVVLFRLFFRDHPLAGQKDVAEFVDEDPMNIEKRLYCSNPIFMFDPNDSSNRPKPEVNKNVMMFWPDFPPYIHKMFIQGFDKNLLQSDGGPSRQNRLTEKQILNELLHLNNNLIVCNSCGEKTIFNLNRKEYKCIHCMNVTERPMLLNINSKKIPLYKGREILKCDLNDSGNYQLEDMVAEGIVIENKKVKGLLGIRNISDKVWFRISSQGHVDEIRPNEVFPIVNNNKLKIQNIEGYFSN